MREMREESMMLGPFAKPNQSGGCLEERLEKKIKNILLVKSSPNITITSKTGEKSESLTRQVGRGERVSKRFG